MQHSDPVEISRTPIEVRLVQVPGPMVRCSRPLDSWISKILRDISRQTECGTFLVPERREVEITDGLQKRDLLRTVS